MVTYFFSFRLLSEQNSVDFSSACESPVLKSNYVLKHLETPSADRLSPSYLIIIKFER
jgi:hypothetical protein